MFRIRKYRCNNFAHIVQAQSMVYDEVIQELYQGRKETHWMWYIFPQLKGLGTSLKAQKYGSRQNRIKRRFS